MIPDATKSQHTIEQLLDEIHAAYHAGCIQTIIYGQRNTTQYYVQMLTVKTMTHETAERLRNYLLTTYQFVHRAWVHHNTVELDYTT